jgi:hypothetical protein
MPPCGAPPPPLTPLLGAAGSPPAGVVLVPGALRASSCGQRRVGGERRAGLGVWARLERLPFTTPG